MPHIMQPRPSKGASSGITIRKGTLMPIVAVRFPAGRAGPTDDFSRSIAEGVFEVLVDGRMVEAAVSVGTVLAEVVFIAEFVGGDAFFEVALFVEGRGWMGVLIR
jgi:hypothetical protein